MGDHGGQVPGGTFDVRELWVSEPPGEDAPAEAIPKGGDFTFHAKFTGTGRQWKNMKDQKHTMEVIFHAEGMGATEKEVDYDPANPTLVVLNPGTDLYEATFKVTANTLPVGLYRCGCTVVDKNWHGAVGYYEGLIIQIFED